MNTYLQPIMWSFLLFPFLAFLFTLPYILYQYRKYGSIFSIRAVIIYSFLLYLLTSYFLVILPLPNMTTVEQMTGPTIQLQPFAFLTDFLTQSNFDITKPSSYLAVIKEPYFYQVFYNILLFLPLGIYLKYYFQCSLLKTIGCSFLLSLFFEVTQLTGLYGIYPRPYRLFDIDDLMLNTLGGTIGFWITPILEKFLPSREKMEQESYEKGKKVSYLRRLIPTTFDFVFFTLLNTILQFFLNLPNLYLSLLSILIYFIILPRLRNDQTIGKRIVKIKLETINHTKPTWLQYGIRYAILCFFIMVIPKLFLYGLRLMVIPKISPYLYLGYAGTMFLLIVIIYVIHPFYCMVKKNMFWYEKYSTVVNVSTIQVKKIEKTGEEHEDTETENL